MKVCNKVISPQAAPRAQACKEVIARRQTLLLLLCWLLLKNFSDMPSCSQKTSLKAGLFRQEVFL